MHIGLVELVGREQVGGGAGERAVGVRVVGREDHRIGVRLHHRGEPRFDLLDRNEALAAEVVGRIHRERAAVEAEQLEMLVEAVQVRQRPHRARLEERDAQARMALEDAVGHERREREHLLGDEVRRMQGRVVVVEAALQLVEGHEPAHARVDAEGHVDLFEVGPQRLVRVVLEARQRAKVLGTTPHAAEPVLLDAAARFGERVLGARHRQRGDADQA